MIDLGPHAAFIEAAYLGVALIVLGLVFWVIWRARRIAARLAALDARGIRRRSDSRSS